MNNAATTVLSITLPFSHEMSVLFLLAIFFIFFVMNFALAMTICCSLAKTERKVNEISEKSKCDASEDIKASLSKLLGIVDAINQRTKSHFERTRYIGHKGKQDVIDVKTETDQRGKKGPRDRNSETKNPTRGNDCRYRGASSSRNTKPGAPRNNNGIGRHW